AASNVRLGAHAAPDLGEADDRRDIVGFLARLAFFVVTLWLLFGVVLGVGAVTTGEMAPRICSGDVMLYWRLSQSFNEGDVVVYTADGEERLGRVVARPGDEVTITESGELMVNGAVVVESDITTPTPRYESAVDYPVHLAADELFVLADLREGGHDSRLYGPIARSQIKGNVISVLRRSNL
ncbi:MAG: signal peptidase I, partial [Collinsella sp.]|nr:signal peptidase I [Collinsella sp.]